MANVQIENGYTKIANEILDAMAMQPLNGTQHRIIDVIWRYTYGFNRKDAKLSESFIAKATGIDRRNIRREMAELINKNIVIVLREADFKSARVVRFNKNYDKWVRVNRPPQGKISPAGEIATTPGGELAPTPGGELTPQERNNVKKTLKKSACDEFFESIWKLYPKHKGKGKVSKAQKEKLFKIGHDEIPRAIERYKKEMTGKDPQYIMYGSTFFNSGYVDYLDKNYGADQEKQGTGSDIYAGYTDFTGKFKD